MKRFFSVAAVATLVGLIACGSQVVEFPEDGASTPDSGDPNKLPPPDPGQTDPVDSGEPPCDCEQDSGLPDDDAGQPDDDGGAPDEDAGQPGTDGGKPPVDAGKDSGKPEDCDDDKQCDFNHGQCVSACAHKCKRDNKQCSRVKQCFYECKCVCDARHRECKKHKH